MRDNKANMAQILYSDTSDTRKRRDTINDGHMRWETAFSCLAFLDLLPLAKDTIDGRFMN